MAAMKKQPAAKSTLRKAKKGIEFYQFPIDILKQLAEGNPALLVAMAVYKGWFESFKRRNPVKLTSAMLAEFGLSKDQKYRALKVLSKNPYFIVERSDRRNPLITMKWISLQEKNESRKTR
jgi:hypothetical protein